ncbi:LytTR family DNA-binding domain-containing protein [Ferrimonas sp. YFM]|uniref:LytR/AlgR family response regulator transcription factor n=1 Tax=Ferrimonas sp. YFM TaxID=3028878 RepID=UPI002573FFE9|nr:LytTR family DNA-binding domain-containing protein [Ferrimonas sp. YFM]BDY04319.1 putative response regulatory protein [Ferrimonas sp. YFM]
MTITAIIADDEPLLRQHLATLLARCWPELKLQAQCADGVEALDAISRHQPQVVFLDIRMPGLDGLALARHLSALAQPPLIVFTTAYDQYAVAAFEQAAVDYLLKPVEQTRLANACQRLQQRLAIPRDANALDSLISQMQKLAPAPAPLKWLKASKGEDLHLIPVEEIVAFRAEDKYVTLHRQRGKGDEQYLLRLSLKELMNQLDSDQFWQIHRANIVRVDAIKRVTRDLAGRLWVEAGDLRLAVSRSAQSLFKEM